MDTLSVYYVWSFFVRSRRRGFCDWNERQTLGTHPDFIAMNYYSTATIGVSRGDGTDVAAGAGDQQIMLDEQRMYKNEKKTHEKNMRKKLNMGMGKTIALVKMVKDIMTVVQFHLKKELDTERNPVFDHSYHTGVSGVTGLL